MDCLKAEWSCFVAEASTGHDGHDELLIASLLDRDPTDPERSIAEMRVATCPDCAALNADLVALSKATIELPGAARTRDYILTADDAARLTASSAGEPRGAAARLTGEMTSHSIDHATHDQLLVAGLLDRSPDDADRNRAEALLAACDDCAALHQDLVVLSEATRALPTPLRLRDFSLSPDDFERLRPKRWRRLIAAFGSSGDIFSRPLAIGLTTIGLAGLLVATIPSVLSGQSGASASVTSAGQAVGEAGANRESIGASRAALAPTAGPSAAAALVAPAAVAPAAEPSAAVAPAAVAPDVSSPGAVTPAPADATSVASPAASSGVAAVAPESSASVRQDSYDATGGAVTRGELPVERASVIVVASLLFVAGLGLFLLRWTARRLGDR